MSSKCLPKGRVDRVYVIRYTLLFLGMCTLVFVPFLLTHASLIKKIDGMSQYIVYLRYMGQYLRRALDGFVHGNFSLPSYDFSIGMGDDIGQIVRFHPFDFLSVFVPSAYTEFLYEGILLLRFYAAGLAFSVFAFAMVKGAAWMNVLSGSMVYVFCGFMLIRVVNHPIYAAPFIVLPLLLLGAEKAMKKEGCSLFVFSVFLGFWSNYYFMYIMSVGLLVYVLVRFPEAFPSDRLKNLACLFGKMAGAYLLGLAMSMMTLYPMILRYLSSARQPQGTDALELLVYADKRRYIAWFLNLISPFQSSGNGTNLNYAVCVLPCLAVLFGFSWKAYRSLKMLTIACLVVLLIPGAGYVLAFFNRENSRWVFLLAMCCAMAVVATVDCFAALTKRQTVWVLASSGGFVALVLLQTLLTGLNVYNAVAAAELVLCVGLLLSPIVRGRSVCAARRCVLAVTCISTLAGSFLTYAPGFGAVTKQYVKAGNTLSGFQNYVRSQGASLIEDDAFYRVEGFNVRHGRENSAVFSGYNGTSEYNSILNADMMDAMISQNNLGLGAITTMRGLDGRPVAMNLAHARYFTVYTSYGTGSVPYGFSPEPAYGNRKVSVYENSHPLSFGYSYRAFITREHYDALDPLEKEMVQLEAVVAEPAKAGMDDPADALRKAGFVEIERPSGQILEETVSLSPEGKGLTYEAGIVHAGRKSRMTFRWKEKAGYDAYLLLEGLDTPDEISNLTLQTKGCKKTINVRSEEQLYNIGKDDYLVHLGYGASDRNRKAKLVFSKAGDYDLSGVKILYMPMETFEERIDALNEEPLEDASIEDGLIRGTVHFSTPRILVLSVLQAGGWTWKVDGETVSAGGDGDGARLLTANVMYQGIVLPEGEHSILLTYQTPGSATGTYIAIPAILAFIVLWFWEMRARRRMQHA